MTYRASTSRSQGRRIESNFRIYRLVSSGLFCISLMLCAERSDPLVLDQPEDHLDAEYIASAVVRHLDEAKERRQVILATHSPNLTVLADAELVIPMYAEAGRGRVEAAG